MGPKLPSPDPGGGLPGGWRRPSGDLLVVKPGKEGAGAARADGDEAPAEADASGSNVWKV